MDTKWTRVTTRFDAQTMMQTLGAKLSHVALGDVQITAPILPTSRQQDGFGHAGLTFSIGDSAAGFAALTVMDPDMEVLTAEMKINLLAPANGAYLRAAGRVIKPGRRLIVVSADVHSVDDTGVETLIAVLQGTMVPIASR